MRFSHRDTRRLYASTSPCRALAIRSRSSTSRKINVCSVRKDAPHKEKVGPGRGSSHLYYEHRGEDVVCGDWEAVGIPLIHKHMLYTDTVQFLYALGNEMKTAKLGLERIRAVLHALGNPERAYRVVHVAGTNGKGSTA